MILCLGSFWPPSIGNLSRSCICKGSTTNILGGNMDHLHRDRGTFWFLCGLRQKQLQRNYFVLLEGSLYLKRYDAVHSKKGRASFWQHKGAGIGPRQTAEPGLAIILKLGSQFLLHTRLVSKTRSACAGVATGFTCPFDRPLSWLKMPFKQSD